MWSPGFGELIVIAIIVLLLFGPSKLTGVGKSLGTAISEFKNAIKSDAKAPEADTSTTKTPEE